MCVGPIGFQVLVRLKSIISASVATTAGLQLANMAYPGRRIIKQSEWIEWTEQTKTRKSAEVCTLEHDTHEP